VEVAQLIDLSVCPDELKALDVNAERLWPIFLQKTGISMSVSGGRVIDNAGRRADVIYRFGIPSLATRLAHAHDEISKARVWWREAVACSEGESIPDLSGANAYLLNPFILTPALKFARPIPKSPSWPVMQGAQIEEGKGTIRIRRARKYRSNAERQRAYRDRAAARK
jgi:hypothetical protein